MIHSMRTGALRLMFGMAGGIGASMLVASLPGCGGGLEVNGGIGGSGYVAGPIDELGSIVVGGIRFSIDDAAVVVNGETAAADELALGMFVGVYGTFDEDGTTGTATRVDFDESVGGPVSFVSADRRRIVVLEQEVILDDSTRLVGLTTDELLPGIAVTVSGSRDADDAIVATLVSRRLLAPGCRVLGEIEQLAVDGSAFRIGDLQVDAAGATVVGGALVEGDPVGVLADSCTAGEELVAREIRRLEVTRPPLPGTLRSVRGFVVFVGPLGNFSLHVPGVGRIPVRVTARTQFEGGTAADISRNDLLRVTGQVDDKGTLRAGRIVFLPSP